MDFFHVGQRVLQLGMLRVYLFQCLQVLVDDQVSLDLGSPTSSSLFAYLVLHRARPSDRRRLAFLFWPDAPEAAARRNLRQYLHHLRRAFEPAAVVYRRSLRMSR